METPGTKGGSRYPLLRLQAGSSAPHLVARPAAASAVWSYAALVPEPLCELLVLGVPVSLQDKKSENRQGWKALVAEAARAVWTVEPLTGPVWFEMIFYFEGRRSDVDNIIKYTQDGLSGIVFVDDAQVERTSSEVLDVDGKHHCRGMSQATALGFVADVPFVVVRVYVAEERRRLP